jgi:nucleoside-diphosphate-sugar epimerase
VRGRHVHEVARAFEAVLHRGVIGEVYNIGTTKEKTVMEVAHTICRFFGLKPADCIEQVPCLAPPHASTLRSARSDACVRLRGYERVRVR